MNRRDFLGGLAASSLFPVMGRIGFASQEVRTRVRPSDPDWPSHAEWQQLNDQVEGRLVKVHSPLTACQGSTDSAQVASTFQAIQNQYYLSDEPGLAQSSGWVDAWVFNPSVYAIAAESASDVAAGVDFARKHNLRLVVKGGGHSYLGTSNAPDSLLIWTHHMKEITHHDAFVPSGGEGKIEPEPAVTVEAGALWMHVYNEVSTKHGRYVQGGGCATVGVAGLVQSGGFGSFSKNFGTAAGNLLEAEIVTADGRIRKVNAVSDPDLFWAIKGGGGGTFGVVTRLTLRTHDLPEFFGAAAGEIHAASDAAFRRLLARFVEFYRNALFNEHWGESVNIGADNTLQIKMVFQGLSQSEAQSAWKPFFDFVAASPADYKVSDHLIVALPARHFWDPDFLVSLGMGVVVKDDRPGAPRENVVWAGDHGQAAVFWHGFESTWLPQSLLMSDHFAAALFEASRSWDVELHFNKGLAGAPALALERARDTATNPAVLDAFALAIIAGAEKPAYPGVPGHEPKVAEGRRDRRLMADSMGAIRKLIPNPGSYVSETNYFERHWQQAFWGEHYGRLARVKRKYDPDGLFYVHHGVGSEGWSSDGFSRVS